jgi:anti-sigma factor RsiW
MTRCAAPLGWDRLVDWLAGELAEGEAAAVEEHLFACAACAAAGEEAQAFVAGVAALIPPVVTAARVGRLRAAGVRVLETPVAAGADADVFFADDVDLAVHALRADLGGAERVDVEMIADPAQPPVDTVPAAPFDAAAGAVYIACQRHYRAMGFPDDMRFRVVAVRGEDRRVLGEYLVRHHFPRPL